MNIDQYIETAKAKNALKSDRKLSEKLGLKGSAVNSWKTRRAWPADDTMIELAKLADVDPADALLDLNIWRSKGEAISIYSSIRNAVRNSAVILLVMFGLQLAPPVNESVAGPSLHPEEPHTLYYGKSSLYLSGRTTGG